ncbi:2-hydroxychromene-2-carboxylate isomerase [Enhydrobacter sp.]|jgi:2-hydroxychromene-2-carboxylate isomerase|uniref:2-hydroxychromene-2-carboxylate isomerase n=1 Tax=Enhydrobacter sp. TaxID=1894999 RepID=UPI0026326D94|nr:2-hydroxychromene-2-carboxylate isomerase [Enhydrobacter sp.]WIM09927.1 MAG: 2-hydroxychromene-2-carboxylate isomerase family protein [Enhydrobacter sp.]
MSKTIEFHWDLGSTNSYFALHLIKPVARKHGATVVPHPFNLGYVFRKQNYVLMEEPKAKLRNRRIDLMRWARRHGLPFRMPTKFPMKTSAALRGALAMRRFGREWEFMEEIFSAYWERDDASVGEIAGLRPVAAKLGVDPERFVALLDGAEIRGELASETDKALQRGVFGAPTFFVGEEMFWGKDRMDFIDEELASPSPPRARDAQPEWPDV